MKKSLEDELADSLGAEMRRKMDFEVVADIMITMRGYTRVEIDYDPNSDHWLDVIAWAGNNCLGDYKEHLGLDIRKPCRGYSVCVEVGIMDEVYVEWEGGAQGPWKPYFTWRPRCINGRWYWLTRVYRRERNIVVYPHQGYEFGDAFDALKDA